MSEAKKALSIDLKPVKSSQIRSIGYDEASKTLAIQFNSGHVYHYDKVPKEVYDGFGKAESIGKYFGKHVKAGGFAFKKHGEKLSSDTAAS